MNKTLLERLLDYYQIDYETYLKITSPTSLESFRNGHEFKDIDKAVNLVKDVISNKGKIIIFGDYDADGIMGTSILVKMFEYLGVVVDYYIPNRYQDGYGLSEKYAQQYINAKYDLVITVDNGITAFDAIELLHSNGVKTLIIDHHQFKETVPVAEAIVHPIYSEFGEVTSSGAFTALVFSISLLGKIDKYLAVLASISLISDMMPLLDYNRNLLRSVFETYKHGEFLAVDLLGDNEEFNEQLIGMKIAPRINSIGRLCEDDSINEIVKYFITNDKGFILNYYSHILDTNETRKELSKASISDDSFDVEDKAIVINGEFKEGVIGLYANSLLGKYHLPVVVFTKSIDGSLKGSARAPEGLNLVAVLDELSDLLLTSGGHASACGCSIKEENFELFKSKFIEILSHKEIELVEHETIDLGISELTQDNYNLISSFGPFGESWPAPLFKIRHIKVSCLTYSRDHKHIITSIGNRQKLVYFNYPKEIENESFIDVVGSISKKSFQGFNYLEFSVKEEIPSK